MLGAAGAESRWHLGLGQGRAPGVIRKAWVWPSGAGGGAGEPVSAASLTSARGLEGDEPGHMMMDWVSPARRGVRPLSLLRPSAGLPPRGGAQAA